MQTVMPTAPTSAIAISSGIYALKRILSLYVFGSMGRTSSDALYPQAVFKPRHPTNQGHKSQCHCCYGCHEVHFFTSEDVDDGIGGGTYGTGGGC
jgi:hypothetical protein